mmetsp:Transcript_19653/g.54869  ORF Transcript_19653/g.54869 Transcript_19653/m.54869 type:complete len:480 (-) Transcript_19653:166-1605(-)
MAKPVVTGIPADALNRTNSAFSLTDTSNDESYTSKSSVIRLHTFSILILGVLGLYSLWVSKHLLAEQELSLLVYGENDATLRRCLDMAGGLWTPQENNAIHRYTKKKPKKNVPIDFRILCTSLDKRISWGSYKLRCNDLKRWADVCAPNVEITVDVSIEELHERWGNNITNEANITEIHREGHSKDIDIIYNSTIFVKSLSRRDCPQFGKKYIDVVDEYNWKQENIPLDMHLIFQTKWQGPALYPNHSFSVVEHWYNSYPSDMTNLGDPEYIPPVEQKSSHRLNIATIWNTRRSHDPTEGGCPRLSIPGVKYSCLDKDFDITSWYLKVLEDSECNMVRTMAFPQLGPGMLYYNVFRQFDALVVLAKNHTEKLEYGNVQRAISQMRSGVPVLLEIRGRVFEDFMNQYNYPCAFRRYHEESIDGEKARVLMSFDEAVEQLKNPEVRRECQRKGLEIVKDYSPSKIGQKFLKTVGYQGDFKC